METQYRYPKKIVLLEVFEKCNLFNPTNLLRHSFLFRMTFFFKPLSNAKKIDTYTWRINATNTNHL